MSEVDRRGSLVLVTSGDPCVIDTRDLVAEALSSSEANGGSDVVLTPVPTTARLSGCSESIEIDPEISALEPDCACCEVRLDLLTHLVRLARRDRPPERVIMLLTEADHPATAVQTVLGDAELRRTWRLDSIVHVTGAHDSSAEARPVLAASIAMADRHVGPGSGLGVALRAKLGAWSIQRTTRRLLHPAGDRLDVGPGGVQHATMSLPGELDPDLLLDWFHDLHQHHGAELLRVEATLRIAGSRRRWVALGTRSTMELLDDVDRHHDEHPSVVRLVGHGFDPSHLHDRLLECLVRHV